jgi:hypothetical protein
MTPEQMAAVATVTAAVIEQRTVKPTKENTINAKNFCLEAVAGSGSRKDLFYVGVWERSIRKTKTTVLRAIMRQLTEYDPAIRIQYLTFNKHGCR